MSALFLLMIPPLALAGYRALTRRGVQPPGALAAALVVAVGATALPAYALRTKPSQGHPLETPVAPVFANRDNVEVLVDYGPGWSEAITEDGRTVRRLSGGGQLTIGPLQATRPQVRLVFDARTASPTRLRLRLGQQELASVAVAPDPAHVAVDVPAGDGPAVLDLSVESGGVLTVPLATVHATATRT